MYLSPIEKEYYLVVVKVQSNDSRTVVVSVDIKVPQSSATNAMTLPPDPSILTVIEATRNPLSNLVKGPRGGIQYLDDVSHTETTHTKN